MTEFWGVRECEKVIADLAHNGRKMLTDKVLAKQLRCSAANAIKALRKSGRIVVELRGEGSQRRRRVLHVASGRWTDWSSPFQQTRKPEVVAEAVGRISWAKAMAGRRYDDMPLKASR